MTPQQINLVKKSWSQILPIADEAGELFYKFLFEAAPGVRHLFKTDVKNQSHKLMAMIGMVVSKLDKLDTVIEEITELAKRHDKYGAQPSHYAVVGETLIKTLKAGLGNKWNDELEEAWSTAYMILSGAMMVTQTNGKTLTTT
jgi:hemoglobin-like flavoprotein